MSDWYWLNPDKTVSLAPDLSTDPEGYREYASWLQGTDKDGKMNKLVAADTIGGQLISTVFLGLDHSFNSKRPVLFETLVFPTEDVGLEEDGERYHTWDEAVAGHEKYCALVRKKCAAMQAPEFTLDEIHQSQVLLKKD